MWPCRMRSISAGSTNGVWQLSFGERMKRSKQEMGVAVSSRMSVSARGPLYLT